MFLLQQELICPEFAFQPAMTPRPHDPRDDDAGDLAFAPRRPSSPSPSPSPPPSSGPEPPTRRQQEEQPKRQPRQQPSKKKEKASSGMTRATSMLEMSDVRDMARFGEEVSALASSSGGRGGAVAHDEEDVGFFLDRSDRSDEEGAGGGGTATGGFLGRLSFDDDDDVGGGVGGVAAPSPASIGTAPTGATPPSASSGGRLGGGMRRVVSLASLPSVSRSGVLGRLGLSATIAPDIHTISEEGPSSSAADDVARDGRAPEVGLDASVTSRRPFVRPIRRSTSGVSLLSMRSASTASTTGGRTPEVGLDASVTSRRSFARRTTSSASLRGGGRAPEVGLDESVSSRRPFRRVPSVVSLRGRTPEVGLDESVSSRRPLRRIPSSVRMTGRAPEAGLDESVTSRKPSTKSSTSSSGAETHKPDEGAASSSSSSRRPSMKKSSSLANVRSAVASGLGLRRASGSSRRPDDLDRAVHIRIAKGGDGSDRSLDLDDLEGCGAAPRGVVARPPVPEPKVARRRSSMDDTHHSLASDGANVVNAVPKAKRAGGDGYGRSSSMDDTHHSIQSDEANVQKAVPRTTNSSRRASGLRSSSRSVMCMDDTTNHSLPSKSSMRRSPSANSMKRNVSFSSLEIRHHPVTLGDCPSSSGPPVQLSWEHDPSATEEHSVDAYESARSQTYRRNKAEMRMPPAHRQYLLMRDAGFAKGEIRAAIDEARRVATRRNRTRAMAEAGLGPVEEAWEAVRRRMAFRKRKKESGNSLP